MEDAALELLVDDDHDQEGSIAVALGARTATLKTEKMIRRRTLLIDANARTTTLAATNRIVRIEA